MKCIVIALIFLGIAHFAFSQEINNYSLKGKSIISAGYGIGNIWAYFLKHNSFIKDLSDYKINSIGPIVINYEYLLGKRIGVGTSLSYSVVSGETKRFLIDEEISIFSALARANYHFSHSKKFDPYVGGGLGYVRSVYKNNTSIPGHVPGEFGYSAQVGANYFLSKHFGLYGEVGYVGGSFVQLGISAKF